MDHMNGGDFGQTKYGQPINVSFTAMVLLCKLKLIVCYFNRVSDAAKWATNLMFF